MLAIFSVAPLKITGANGSRCIAIFVNEIIGLYKDCEGDWYILFVGLFVEKLSHEEIKWIRYTIIIGSGYYGISEWIVFEYFITDKHESKDNAVSRN